MDTLVDADMRDGVKDYLNRILEHATPDSLVEGGATETTPFQTRPRTYDRLKKFEQIYLTGGPVTDLVDARSLMTYGTGVEFATEESAITDDQGQTVDEWLTGQFGETLDYLQIQLGSQSYWSGDAWGLLVESKGDDFSHVELVDPTTVDVAWDDHGQITDITQIVFDENNKPKRKHLDPDRIAHFTFKETPGGPLGHSLIAQNEDEIRRFAQNQTQRANAIRLHGSPKYDISVGTEGQSIPDKIMRKIRNRFTSENVDEKTNWVHGSDLEVSVLDNPGFEGMGDIVETDLQLLASGFGIPLEWTNIGGDGLGTGKPAESRQTKFERQARAEQGLRTKQFVEQVVRPILDRYSPFPEDIHITLQWGDVVSDQSAISEAYAPFQWAYTRDELREKMGDQPYDETGSEEAPPEVSPTAEAGGGMGEEGGGGGGGLFTEPGDEAPDPLDDRTKELHTDGGSGNARSLLHDSVSDGELTQEELVWERVIEDVLWSEETDRQLFQFDPEEVPQFVLDNLREAVQAGALFDSFETVPDAFASQIGDVMLDSLDERHGWSIDSIANNLQEAVPTLDATDAERIARTETQALVAEAREEGYRERDDFGELRFRWVGPSDNRTTETCEAIKDSVPEEGLPFDELKDLVHDEGRSHGHDPRDLTPHVQCRHQPIRTVK